MTSSCNDGAPGLHLLALQVGRALLESDRSPTRLRRSALQNRQCATLTMAEARRPQSEIRNERESSSRSSACAASAHRQPHGVISSLNCLLFLVWLSGHRVLAQEAGIGAPADRPLHAVLAYLTGACIERFAPGKFGVQEDSEDKTEEPCHGPWSSWRSHETK
jgi:hypothetical protein